MMRKLIPVLFLIVGAAVGIGAGLMLAPQPAEKDNAEAAEATTKQDDESPAEFVKLNNQFVVPVVESGRVSSLVVLSLSLEVAAGSREEVYMREPKLRDAFLQVLFDHANMGGFQGAFTSSNTLDMLRMALLETARQHLGNAVHGVLIMDIARQDA